MIITKNDSYQRNTTNLWILLKKIDESQCSLTEHCDLRMWKTMFCFELDSIIGYEKVLKLKQVSLFYLNLYNFKHLIIKNERMKSSHTSILISRCPAIEVSVTNSFMLVIILFLMLSGSEKV